MCATPRRKRPTQFVELADHTASIRSHIKSLSLKQYSELDGVNTLDFVFMFIPVEPAYLLALQHDHSLFQECFDKRIMLVGFSTARHPAHRRQ